MSAVSEQEIATICVACGMCCDGTLFGRGVLKDNNDKKIADSLGLITEIKEGRPGFLQPCQQFSGKCNVYEQKRPLVCGKYFCNPIRQLKRKKMTLHEVRSVIFRTIELKEKFESAIQLFPEFSGKSVFQVRQLLALHKFPAAEQADMRRQYAMLYLLGYKLFPLLKQISRVKQKENDKN